MIFRFFFDSSFFYKCSKCIKHCLIFSLNDFETKNLIVFEFRTNLFRFWKILLNVLISRHNRSISFLTFLMWKQYSTQKDTIFKDVATKTTTFVAILTLFIVYSKIWRLFNNRVDDFGILRELYDIISMDSIDLL